MNDKIFPEPAKERKLRLPFAAIIWAACLVFLVTCARGADPGASPTPDPIDQKVQALIDNAGGSTSAMVAATYEGARLWDQELNRVYAELLQKLPTKDQAILKQSEQEWLKFRDSNRKLIGEVYGQARGTENRLSAAMDVLELVKSRVVMLRAYLEVVENDW
jgi:uncharacterized protein YecT (DUF1311 family)